MDFATDIHSHILFGIDDGARDLEESIGMLKTAKKAGLETIVATPHFRSSRFPADIAQNHLAKVREQAEPLGITILMGYEVHVNALADIGIENANQYCTENSHNLLLEFSYNTPPPHEERLISMMQRQGIQVIIAHPERYQVVQKDLARAKYWVDMGCELQLDALCLLQGRFSKERKCAEKLLQNDLIHHVASDAHSIADYEDYLKALEKFPRSSK